MNREEMQSKAAETLKAAGIDGERGIAVQEGFGSRGARNFDDTVGITIPGASLLIRSAQRVVLVTDKSIYIFQGRRFDRLGVLLGSYPIAPAVMSFDGERATFPDGQTVYMTAFQARTLASAAAIDHFAGTAEMLLKRAGISGERAVTAEAGIDPSTSKKTVRTRVADVVVGDIDDAVLGTGFKESEGRIVLVTDRNVHVFEGQKIGEPGPLLASFPVGPGTLRLGDDRTIVLPDGQVVEFKGVTDFQRLVDAAIGKSS